MVKFKKCRYLIILLFFLAFRIYQKNIFIKLSPSQKVTLEAFKTICGICAVFYQRRGWGSYLIKIFSKSIAQKIVPNGILRV